MVNILVHRLMRMCAQEAEVHDAKVLEEMGDKAKISKVRSVLVY